MNLRPETPREPSTSKEEYFPPSLLWGFQEFLSDFYPNHTVDNTEAELVYRYCDKVVTDPRYREIDIKKFAVYLMKLLNSSQRK